MEKYKVKVKFSKPGNPNPNLVTITGLEENIEEAKEEILNLAEDFVSFGAFTSIIFFLIYYHII